MKVGLYFGSFNPVHIAHLNLANHLLDNNIVDEVWFVVSPCNPLKRQTDLLDENIRMNMLNLTIAGNPNLKTSDIEFSMPIPSYTINTLEKLSSLYPDIQFFLIIGSDNALVFNLWKDYERILKHYPVLVYPRPGYDFKQVEALYPQMRLLPTPDYDISSTEIRKAIAENKDVSGWLHPAVLQYILDNNFFVVQTKK